MANRRTDRGRDFDLPFDEVVFGGPDRSESRNYWIKREGAEDGTWRLRASIVARCFRVAPAGARSFLYRDSGG
jgi:hypothetical protein